jgi:hypothetical protein
VGTASELLLTGVYPPAAADLGMTPVELDEALVLGPGAVTDQARDATLGASRPGAPLPEPPSRPRSASSGTEPPEHAPSRR